MKDVKVTNRIFLLTSIFIRSIFFLLIFHPLMFLYRRRICIYCLLFLIIILQPLIYRYYSSDVDCENKVEIFIPENITDRENIYNLHTRILCWIPTTLQRLDRALVVHE